MIGLAADRGRSRAAPAMMPGHIFIAAPGVASWPIMPICM